MTFTAQRQPRPTDLPRWVLDAPFDMRPFLRAFKVRWDAERHVSVWVGERLPHALQPFAPLPFSWEWSQQYFLNGRHLQATTWNTDALVPRPHQEVAIEAIAKAQQGGLPGFLLADDVGVGKTLSAWTFARRETTTRSVLIVTTASAQAQWRHTILSSGARPDQSVLITTYDRLGRLFQTPDGLTSTRRKGKRKRIAKQGVAPTFDLVIFDEAHKGKNPESARGIMMRKIGSAAQFCLWLSATAGQNPLDLAYLAPLLAQATGSRLTASSMDAYVEWCQKHGISVEAGPYGSWVCTPSREEAGLLHEWLFKGNPAGGLRRLPQDVAGWPALERRIVPVSLDATARQAYATAWDSFVSQWMTLQKQAPSARQRQEREKQVVRLRQEISWLRLPSTVDMIGTLLESGVQVAVSVAFRATLQELSQQLQRTLGVTPAVLEGSQDTVMREQERLAFQRGETPVILFTVEEAISLHQGEHNDVPRVLLIHDLRWSALQMAQIEGRCHRDGRLAPVWWLVGENTIDGALAQRLRMRLEHMKTLHGDSLSDLDALDAVLQQAAFQQET